MPQDKAASAPPDASARDRLTDRFSAVFLWLMLRLPYRWRIPLAGWVVSRVVSPLAGYSQRIRENLALIFPDMPPAEVQRLVRAVPDNVGRTITEIWSGAEFIERVRDLPMTGPGVPHLETARRAGRPVVLATGHFGNYDAWRGSLIARGYRIGALYKPMQNRAFNARYLEAISTIGTPLFPRGKQGLAEMVKFIRSGGMLGLAIDQSMAHGEPLTFFGQTAMTATSAADLALKYGAALIPIYAVRRANGLDFDIVVEEPIPSGDPVQMTQAINDSLEALARRHPEQWFWIHRRWKSPPAGRN